MILPVWALTKNPILCYNLVFLSTFLLSALGMFLFARNLTSSPGAAFVAGIAFGFAPYRFGTMSHVQVLSAMWMPFTSARRASFLRDSSSRNRSPERREHGWLRVFRADTTCCFSVRSSRSTLAGKSCGDACGRTRASGSGLSSPALWRRWQPCRFCCRMFGSVNSDSPRVHSLKRRVSPLTFTGYATADIGLRLWGNLVRAWPKPEGSLFPGFTIGFLATLARFSTVGWALGVPPLPCHGTSNPFRVAASQDCWN